MNTRKIAGAMLVLAGISIGLAGPASATKNTEHKEWILHPVNGKGELKNGYNCISPDKHSSHFDDYGHPKHEAEGRVDKLDTEGLCTKPDPTTSTVTTSSTTTAPTTSTTTSSSSTTSTSSSSTSSTTTTSNPSTTTAVVPTTNTPSTTSIVPPKEVNKPKPVITPAPVVNTPPTELPHTGPLNMLYTYIGVLIVLVGLAITFAGRKIEVIRNE